MTDYIKFIDKRKIEKKNNIVIVSPINDRGGVPLACPLCTFLMRNHGDAIKFREFGCCAGCSLYFAEPNREKWEGGWRPSQPEIDKVIKKRKEQYSYIVNL